MAHSASNRAFAPVAAAGRTYRRRRCPTRTRAGLTQWAWMSVGRSSEELEAITVAAGARDVAGRGDPGGAGYVAEWIER